MTIRFAFFALAASFFATTAGAAATATRLELVIAPAEAGSDLPTTHYAVTPDGRVWRWVSDANQKPLSETELDRLTPLELQRINALIDQSRPGHIETIVQEVHCRAISPYLNRYFADNGQVFLASNRLCEDPTENTAAAAKGLVEFLDSVSRNEVGP